MSLTSIAAKFIISFVLVALCVNAQAQEEAVETAAEQASKTYDDLLPRSKQLLIRRAAEIVRTPDGQLWDGWGEFEYRRAYNKSVRKIRTTTRTRSNGWTIPTASRSEWELVSNNDAEAWAISTIKFMGLEGFIEPRQSPPLWQLLTATPESSPDETIVYIDEIDRLPHFRDLDIAHLNIENVISAKEVEVKVNMLSSSDRVQRQIYKIKIPDEKYLHRKGHLIGRYLLWNDGSTHINTKIKTWQLVPYEDAAVTPQELHEAIANNNAALHDWSYRRLGGSMLWERQKIELEYRKP